MTNCCTVLQLLKWTVFTYLAELLAPDGKNEDRFCEWLFLYLFPLSKDHSYLHLLLPCKFLWKVCVKVHFFFFFFFVNILLWIFWKSAWKEVYFTYTLIVYFKYTSVDILEDKICLKGSIVKAYFEWMYQSVSGRN